MARKSAKSGEVNKSAEIRALLTENPTSTAKEVIDTLARRGIKIHPNQFYFVKGTTKGRKGRRKKARQMVVTVSATMGANCVAPAKTKDVIATILKVKHVAAEVGGLKKLKALVEALGE